MLSDYHAEFAERNRIGLSGVIVDDLVLPTLKPVTTTFFDPWDKIVIFPGCIVSSRFPWLVLDLYKMLAYFSVPQDKIVIDDESCCGSFLQQVDRAEFVANGRVILKKLVRRGEKTLVLTMCGSCTSSLRDLARQTSGLDVTIMHYFSVLSAPEIARSLSALLKNEPDKHSARKPAYLQIPCQAFWNPNERLATVEGMAPVLLALGFESIDVKRDLGCCGAAMLDTHPDFALEFGTRRLLNLTMNGSTKIETIFIGCGNCYRMYSDFKPSMDVEFDQAGDVDIEIQFLLHLISVHVR